MSPKLVQAPRGIYIFVAANTFFEDFCVVVIFFVIRPCPPGIRSRGGAALVMDRPYLEIAATSCQNTAWARLKVKKVLSVEHIDSLSLASLRDTSVVYKILR